MLELTIFIKYKNYNPMDDYTIQTVEYTEENLDELTEKLEIIHTSIVGLTDLGLVDSGVLEIYGQIYQYDKGHEEDGDGDILEEFTIRN